MTIALFLLLLFSLSILGCGKPSGDPKALMQKYFQAIDNGDSITAYDCLTDKIKAMVNKDDFVLRQNIYRTMRNSKGTIIGEPIELGEQALNGQKYKNTYSFSVAQKFIDSIDNKEYVSNYTSYVVNDNGNWRIHSETYNKYTIKELLAAAYSSLGWFQLKKHNQKSIMESKSSNDILEAISSFKKSLHYNSTFSSAHRGLASAYIDAERYNEAIPAAIEAVKNGSNNKEKSSALVTLGVAYSRSNRSNDAIRSFREALELDPDNEYARSNLKIYGL